MRTVRVQTPARKKRHACDGIPLFSTAGLLKGDAFSGAQT